MGEKVVPTNTLDSICSTKAIVSLTGVKVKAGGGGAASWQTRGAGSKMADKGGRGSKMADKGGGAARWQTRGGGAARWQTGEAARWQTSLVHAPTPLSHMNTVVQHTL